MKNNTEEAKKGQAVSQAKIPRLKKQNNKLGQPDSTTRSPVATQREDSILTKNQIFSVAPSYDNSPSGNQKEAPSKRDRTNGSENTDANAEKRTGRWDKEEKEKFVEGKFDINFSNQKPKNKFSRSS